MKSNSRFIKTGVVRSPARINLLGEHLDYNAGIVMPAAIDRFVNLTFKALNDPLLHLYAQDLDQECIIPLEKLNEKTDVSGKTLPEWALYPAGVAWILQNNGYKLSGILTHYQSNIPIGAGLSSSAAIQIAFALAIQTISNWQLDRKEMAELCREAENQFIGVQSGIMDQFACLFGVKDNLLVLDTRDLSWSYLPFPKDISIVVADSRVSRSLASSKYNTRREECQQALRIFQKFYPSANSLRDIKIYQFNQISSEFSSTLNKRIKFILEEQERVLMAVNFLKNNCVHDFGKLMTACHQGLKELYEVSCEELDILVDIAINLQGCLGARLTGAGFGGCTVNLVRRESTDEFIKHLSEKYKMVTGKDALIYSCLTSQGAHLI